MAAIRTDSHRGNGAGAPWSGKLTRSPPGGVPAARGWPVAAAVPASSPLIGHGCECNRATLDSILAAGFSVSDLRRDTLPRVPAILRPLLIGCAESTKQPRPSAGSSPAPGQGSCEAAQSSSIQVCGGRYTSTRPSRSRTGSLGSEGSTWGSFWFSTSPDGVNHTPWHGHSSRPAA